VSLLLKGDESERLLTRRRRKREW